MRMEVLDDKNGITRHLTISKGYTSHTTITLHTLTRKMKSSIAFVSLLTGMAIGAPQGGLQLDAYWNVSKLYASAEPHGSLNFYSLNLATSANNVTCSGEGVSYQVLGSLPQTACSPSTFSFAWTASSYGGAYLQLWDAITGQIASHNILADQTVWENQQDPNGAIQVYVGPREFQVITALA
ncbi:hypothetical protein BX600DRAFT_140615 [Xylariales sp. PMI_506]|nr:hypothetical protein BX600DRAFT_140615 [Xylariales sp. PMI_506]